MLLKRQENRNIILACSAWKNKVNFEDTLMAGAIIHRIKDNFQINCDSSRMAELLFSQAGENLFEFMKENNASHYNRLMGFGLEEDLRYCFTIDNANCVNLYENGRLTALKNP